MSMFSEWIWEWPNGLVWRLTRGPSVGSRKKKFERFLETVQPTAETSILDVGVSGVASGERAENFLEEWYKHPERITAVGIGDLEAFRKRYPTVRVVEADARNLPFSNHAFDVVFSNAVIEHVGGRKDQEKFIRECLRVGKSVFITTPSRCFPLESHTMIPFVHWLPVLMRNALYRRLGREHEGTKGNLTLLTARSFRQLFPKGTPVRIVRQRFLGMTSVLIAVVDSNR